MNIRDLENTINRLNEALEITDDEYQRTGDKTLRFDVVTLKVVISNMQKRLQNNLELAQRAQQQEL